MSDVGLGANLELSIADALRRVDQLGAQIDQISRVEVTADTTRVSPAIASALDATNGQVQVTADAASVSASVTAAVDAADTDVEVTGDASQVTGAVDGAVDNADTAVEVTGDASQVTGAINGAVSDAQAEAHVDVDGSVSPALQTDVLNLGANLADASDEASGLSGLLAGLTVGAAAAGLFQLADAASEAEQSVGGVEAVFGSAAGVIEDFASQSARSAGIAATGARTLTAQIGGLLQGFDFTQQEAAATSVVLAQLGADLAATFGGSPEEAVQALGGALRGEFNPLERFGVSLNVAQINAFALEKGLAASTEEIDLATRAQAALQLIMERTANAQGQFARESETAAGALAIAKAGAQDLAAEAGQNLTPAFLALVDTVSRDVLPALAEAGDDVLPAISDAIVNLTPLLGTTTQLFVAAAPVIELVADVLAKIPPEAIAIGGSLLVANKAIGGLGSVTQGSLGALQVVPAILGGIAEAVPRATAGTGRLAGGITGLASSVANLNPLTVGATLLAAGLFAEWQHAGEEAKRFANEVDELEGSLESVDGRLQLTTGGVTRYVREASKLAEEDTAEDLAKAGIAFSQVAAFAQQGQKGLHSFTSALEQAGDVTTVYRDGLGGLVDAQGNVVDEASELGQSLIDVNGRLVIGHTDLIEKYEDISKVVEEASHRQIALAAASGSVTQQQIDQALAVNDSGDATRSYAEALNILEPAISAAAKAQADAQAKYDEIAASYLNVAAAARTVGDEAPSVNKAIADISSGAVPGERGFLNLALALDTASLSEEGFAAAATVLGTDVETLQAFVDSARESIDSFVETAANGLPTVQSLLAQTQTDANDAARAQADAIVASAQDRAEQIRDAAAKQIADAGDELTAAQGDAIRSTADQNAEAIVEAAQTSADAIADSGRITASAFTRQLSDAAADIADFRSDLAAISAAGFTDVAGLLAEQGSEIGGQLADELSDALATGNVALLEELSAANQTFQTETTTTVDYMRDVLGPELILVSGLMGEGAAQALFEGMDFGERIRIQGELAKTDLSEQGQVIAVVAATQGTEVARQFGANLQLDQETIDAGVAAGVAMQENAPTAAAKAAGVATGDAFGAGVEQGISDREQRVNDKAQQLVLSARAAAGVAAQEGSPAKLFVTLGENMGAGVEEGLDASSRAVVAAAEQIVRDAADAVGRVSPEITAEASGGPGFGGAGGGGAIPDSLIRALEAIATQGPALQFGPIIGGDTRSALRDAVTEARAISRGTL